MKKLFKPLLSLAVLGTLVFGVAACTTDSDDEQGLTSDQTIAYSTYMAGTFMGDTSSNTTSDSNNVITLAEHTDEHDLQVEERLGEVNENFNRFKVFLDNGMENPFDINQNPDVEGDWDIAMAYTVNEKDYTILLNEDSEGNLTGTMTLMGVEYDVEGTREFESESETEDGETYTETANEIFIRTIEQDNSDNFMELSIETEEDHEAYEFEMALEGVLDGVEKEMSIAFEIENDEVSIEMENQDGTAYAFSRETDDNNQIDYEFSYAINGVEGEIEMTVTTNENGEQIYRYSIEEEGMEKEIDIDENEDDDDTTA